MAPSFESDEVKAEANRRKHGVSFDEAAMVQKDLDEARAEYDFAG